VYIVTVTFTQANELQFQLKCIGNLEQLSASERFNHADSETIAMILEQAAQFAAEKLVPLAASSDLSGCLLDEGRVIMPAGTREAWQTWCDLGFPALDLPGDFDGLDMPLIVLTAVQEITDGAHQAFGMLSINLRCAALALIKNANEEQIQQYLPGLVTGTLASTIAISEPQAGSDVGRILTKAEPQADGSWAITGNKIWISFADHDVTDEIIHLVLARIPNGEVGTRGLGLFLVPACKNTIGLQTNGTKIERLEHKMGLHSSPTCVLNLEKAKGWLVGEEGKGLTALFVMMNAMRLAVGAQGSAVANVAALEAIAYAKTRSQGGSPSSKAIPISEHADVQRMLQEMRAQAALARALVIRTAALFDASEVAIAHQENAKAQELKAIAELLLPLAKTLNAEAGFQIASQGIQVLGGYGYTSDYPLERMVRDIRVAAIYEGTSGIQAMDFLKRKVQANGGSTLELLFDKITMELSTEFSPFSSLWPKLRSQANSLLQEKSVLPQEGAYALMQYIGLLITCWNGHRLYVACEAERAAPQGLKEALHYYAATLQDNSNNWLARALTPLQEFTFSNFEIN
jgi:alkylation response protein AidB-like acyl-CoA dehydrogenase